MIIGIGGYLRSGKDTVADYLVADHGFVKVGMSDILGDAMRVLDPLIPSTTIPNTFERYSTLVDAVGYVKAKENPEVRRFLQVFGTEVGRGMLGEDIWVHAMELRIRRLVASERSVILTGVRYPNELELIHRLKGVTIWVDRPGCEPSAHSSENSVNVMMFDRIIFNNGTLNELYSRAALAIGVAA